MKFYSPSALLLTTLLVSAPPVHAAEYKIDASHSFVEFRIQHLGYSWLYGRFNTVTGSFSFDANKPEASEIEIRIDTASIDSNHAERDKHLRGDDFLDVEKFPQATFRSTGFTGSAEQGSLSGELTLHGVTKPITVKISRLGEGKDPWGGYRAGFAGTMVLDRRDFGIDKNLGPASWELEMEFGVEGIRN